MPCWTYEIGKITFPRAKEERKKKQIWSDGKQKGCKGAERLSQCRWIEKWELSTQKKRKGKGQLMIHSPRERNPERDLVSKGESRNKSLGGGCEKRDKSTHVNNNNNDNNNKFSCTVVGRDRVCYGALQ